MSPEAQSLLNAWSPPLALDVAILLTALFYFRGWLTLRRSSPRSHPVPASRRFSCGHVLSLVRHWLAALRLRRSFSHRPHDPTHSPDACDSSPRPSRRALPASPPRAPPVVCAHHARTFPALVNPCNLSGSFSPILSSAGFSLRLPSSPGMSLPHSNSPFAPTSGTKSNTSASSLLPSFSGGPSFSHFPPKLRWPRWSIPLYLFFGMFPSSALGAFLAFCDRVLYPSYSQAPALFRITPLADQILAGSLMWVFGVFVCIIPSVLITLKLLSPRIAHPGAPLPHSPKLTGERTILG